MSKVGATEITGVAPPVEAISFAVPETEVTVPTCESVVPQEKACVVVS
jgi:hypothetical protein